MTDTNRSDALAVRCPSCDAHPGQACWGARGRPRESMHGERHRAAALAPQRELRYYDLPPAPIPLGHTDYQPPTGLEPIDPATCALGLDNIARIRAQQHTRRETVTAQGRAAAENEQ